MALAGYTTESGAGTYLPASPSAPATLYTAAGGAGKITRVEKLLIANMDTANAVTLTLYHVASGGSISSDDWTILKAFSIPASNGTGGTEDIREVAGLILDNGDSLRALAGTSGKLRFSLSVWNES